MDLDPRTIMTGGLRLAERAVDETYFAALLMRSGVLGIDPPHRVAKMLLAFERYGLLGGSITAAALRHGEHPAILDERGTVSYSELDAHSNALANAWRDEGLQAGEGVAILVRNHRGFLQSVFAAAKCGARIILLNTSFAGPQIREVAGREGTDLLVHDEEYSELLSDIDPPRGSWRAWVDEPAEDTLDALIERGDTSSPPKPSSGPRIIILTSGTTGTPKGAPHSEPKSLSLLGGLLSKVPFRAREVTELCVPMFHALGFAQALVGVGLGSTLVIRRRFDPVETLESVERHRATAMVMVPVMLQRAVDKLPELDPRPDTSSLRIIFLSGSALGAHLAERAMEAFGPVVYNLYGSTEVAYATIATPEDLREEPSTAGKVVRGSVVKLFDENGREVPPGDSGRIFVGNAGQFEGYTGGGGKEVIDGLMASGDVGHFDEEGRLFIDGRDDEMIVSGGENVFPAEVEELLARHAEICEAAVTGVEDEQFGQRLKAFVVLREGASLSEDQVKGYVKDNLARYKVPRDVVFVPELPRNATGKVLKRDLERQQEDGDAPGQAGGQEDGDAPGQAGGEEEADAPEQASTQEEGDSRRRARSPD